MMEELLGQAGLVGPVLAQIGVTVAVLVYLFFKRLPILMAAKLSNTEMTRPGAVDQLPDAARFPSDNFKNLAEVPILFYATCFAAMLGGMVDDTAVMLAWIFVGFRAVHSLIQCTYNVVMHRFAAYLISSAVLMILWGRMAWGYFLG